MPNVPALTRPRPPRMSKIVTFAIETGLRSQSKVKRGKRCVTMSYTRIQRRISMGTLTIRLDDKLDRELARLAKRTGRTKSEVAREALRRQLSIQQFRALRREAMPYPAAAGYLTDEDVFRSAS